MTKSFGFDACSPCTGSVTTSTGASELLLLMLESRSSYIQDKDNKNVVIFLMIIIAVRDFFTYVLNENYIEFPTFSKLGLYLSIG